MPRRSHPPVRPRSTSSGASSRTRHTPTASCDGRRRPRRPRPGARAAARLRHGAARPHARPRDRDRRAGGRCGRLDAAVRAALRLGAYQLVFLDGVPRYAAVNESVELVRRAGSSGRCRSRTPCSAGSPTRGAPRVEGPAGHDLERGRRCSTRTRTGSPRRGGATSARTSALALMRAQNEAPATVVRLVRGEIDGAPDPDVPGAWHVEHVDEDAFAEGPGVAAEPRLSARRARGRVAAGRAGARPLRRAGRQGDDARRRGRRRRGRTRPAPASSRRTSRGSGRRTCRSSAPTAAPCRRSSRASTGRSSTRRARGSACSPPTRSALARPAAARAPARAAAGGRRARQARRHDRLLRLHGQPRGERGGRRRLRARGRRSARRRVAAVPPSAPARSSC